MLVMNAVRFGKKIMDKCDERLERCTTRMKTQDDHIETLFKVKASRGLLVLFFVVLLSSFAYTFTVAEDVKQVVTKTDMIKYQESIIKAIEGIK